MIRLTLRLLLWLLLTELAGATVVAQPADPQPVRSIADQRLLVRTSAGEGQVPLDVSQAWNAPQSTVTRAVIVVHGALRNADAALRTVEQARVGAGSAAEATLLVAPQFLIDADVTAHALRSDILRWSLDGWETGEPATGPAPLSSFDVLDSILAHLADRRLFPALRVVVVAGHSAGAHLLQRYAAVGHGEAALTAEGVAIRYVVANPASYLWFGELRPRPTCPGFDRWDYGLRDPPPYVGDTRGMERRFIARDVVYLLGEADTDAAHPMLDRSCAAMAQGENRFARGMLYLLFLEQRHPNLVRHRVFAIPGIGHDARGMFASICGRAAVFGMAGCTGL